MGTTSGPRRSTRSTATSAPPRRSRPTWRSRRSWPAPRRRSCRWTGRTRASRHRWAAASTARCRKPRRAPGTRRPTSYTPPLGDRVDAALDALAADPEPYTPQLGGRVDAALDALTTWEDSSPSEASWDTEWASEAPSEAPDSESRALDLFASALTDEQLADAGLDAGG